VVSVYLNAQQLSGSTQVSKLEVLGQLQDKLVNGCSRLGCKGHVIHKHRQYDSDISLDIDIDGCIRVRLGKAQGLEYRTHLLVPTVLLCFSGRQCNNALQLRRPGDSTSANLNTVATCGTSCVFASTMISIRVCAEQFGAGRVRCIGDGVISCTLEIAKEVLDSMPVSNTWVRVESG